MTNRADIKPVEGKLGIMLVGLGAVSTTFIAGVETIKKGLAKPIGSLTQMGAIRLGKRTEHKNPLIKELVPLYNLDDLVITSWDIFEDNAYQAALKAGVLERHHLDSVKDELESMKPQKAVFNQEYVKKLSGTHVKTGNSKRDLANQLMDDIQSFKEMYQLRDVVMIWCASTEIFIKTGEIHQSMDTFEKAIDANHPEIAPSMLYAYAALQCGIPFINGAPNLSVDFPAMIQLADMKNVPIAGKDFKTGQTLMKTILAPGLKARLLGLSGWFSTNLLGNRDGEVLDDPESFKTKEESKLSVLEYIFQPDI